MNRHMNQTMNPEGPTMTNDSSTTWHLEGVSIPFQSWEQARAYREARPELGGRTIYPKVYNWSNAR